MEILKHIIPLSAAAILLTGCEQEFEPDIYVPEALCINSVITSGEPVSANISHTWRYDEDFEEKIDCGVYDATVTLTVDGRPVETLRASDSEQSKKGSVYRFSHIAAPGEDITITAESGKYGEAHGSVIVPQPAGNLTAVPDFKAKRVTGESDESQGIVLSGGIKATITDTEASTDFYRLEAKAINAEPIGSGEWVDVWGEDEPVERKYVGVLEFWMIDKEHETLFQEHLGVLDVMFGASTYGLTIFSDRMFSGRDYTLDVVLREAFIHIYNPLHINSIYDVKVRLTLSTLSSSYYNYWLSDFQASEGFIGQMGDLGLAQGVNGYSNVSTKAGVIMAATPTTVDVSLADFIRTTLGQ